MAANGANFFELNSSRISAICGHLHLGNWAARLVQAPFHCLEIQPRFHKSVLECPTTLVLVSCFGAVTKFLLLCLVLKCRNECTEPDSRPIAVVLSGYVDLGFYAHRFAGNNRVFRGSGEVFQKTLCLANACASPDGKPASNSGRKIGN